MYKSNKNNQKYVEGFIRIVKSLQTSNEELANKTIK